MLHIHGDHLSESAPGPIRSVKDMKGNRPQAPTEGLDNTWHINSQ